MISIEKLLKPCPLCGQRVKITKLVQYDYQTEVTIECQCGLSFHHVRVEITYEKSWFSTTHNTIVGTGLFTEDDFITAWNRRYMEVMNDN